MPEDMVQAACDCSPHVIEWLREVTRVYAAHDLDGVDELITDDIVFADHRPLTRNAITGREETRAFFRMTFELLPDFKVSVLVLAQDGDTYLARDTYEGHAMPAEGGGEALMQWWVVDTIRDGRLAREDVYATEEEAREEYGRRTAEKRTVHPPS